VAKVFVSHRGVDAAPAERLAADLRSAGHEVWLDAWKIDPGDSIVEKMDAGLASADAVVLCLSADADGVNTAWMQREWASWPVPESSPVAVTARGLCRYGTWPPEHGSPRCHPRHDGGLKRSVPPSDHKLKNHEREGPRRHHFRLGPGTGSPSISGGDADSGGRAVTVEAR